jgi:prevent-host-death family protein
MEHNIVLSRELQRNYRKLINTVKKTRQPLYIGARHKSEAVLLDIDEFKQLQQRADKKQRSWTDTRKILETIRASGKGGVNLGLYIHEDRQAHI